MRGYRSWSAASRGLAVEGEITGLGTDKRGHMYFSLKDPSGVLAAVMFAGKQVYGLKFAPKNGDKVHAFGHIDVFVRDGKYRARRCTGNDSSAGTSERSGEKGRCYGIFLCGRFEWCIYSGQ